MLTPDDIEDIITDLSCRNAAGGIYTGSVHEFARAIESAVREQVIEEAAQACSDRGDSYIYGLVAAIRALSEKSS